ncbi:hypothetical protein CLIB1444_03S10968 [[Candida] jaroonii]|uniref:Uncharacterized protein n=1 Tax=[Candida] jaroonii TaxID=467808 RepID=A0ACA9Y6Z0_9ASCO|nr:hypothetical protein CLIB1444_03S10968 [[Candida] jaroonii]
MSQIPIKSAINDIAPGIEPSTLPQLTSFCERLYNISKGKSLNKNEIVRYHICAYLTIEKYLHSLNLPDPQINKIPLPSKTTIKLINEFRGYLNEISGSSSPRSPLSLVSTPLSQRRTNKTTITTPSRSSPLKKLQALAAESESDANEEIDEDNPFLTKKSSPKKSPTKSPRKPVRYNVENINIPQLIQLCENFYIPASTTKHIIQCFINKRHKFSKKSDWYLACALVYAAYIRINDKLVKEKIKFNETVINQLMRHQLAHLKKPNLVYWVNVLNNDIKDEPWIIELDKKYIYGIKAINQHDMELVAKLGNDYELYDSLGCMKNPHNDYLSKTHNQYFENWSYNILNQLRD